jgi:hypothetical protein
LTEYESGKFWLFTLASPKSKSALFNDIVPKVRKTKKTISALLEPIIVLFNPKDFNISWLVTKEMMKQQFTSLIGRQLGS